MRKGALLNVLSIFDLKVFEGEVICLVSVGHNVGHQIIDVVQEAG